MLDLTDQWYFSPDDDCKKALLDFAQTAQKSLLLVCYSYNMHELTEIIIQKHQAGVQCSLLLDKSQASSSTERPEVQALKDAGVPLLLGTSELRRIKHDKYMVIDGEWIEQGSYNYTEVAGKEDNVENIRCNPDIAKFFAENFEKQWVWVKEHEPQG